MKVVLAYNISDFLKMQREKAKLYDKQNLLLSKNSEGDVKDEIEEIKLKMEEIDK